MKGIIKNSPIYLFCVVIVLCGNIDKIFLNGFPIRKLAFVIFLISLAFVFFYRRKINKELLVVFGLFSFFFVLFSIIVPYLKGVSLNDSITETFPFLLPLLSLLIIRNFTFLQYYRLEIFVKRVLIVFAFIHIVTAFMYLIDKNIAAYIYALVKYFFNDSSSFSSEGNMENSIIIPRVQLGMSIVLLLGLYYALIDFLNKINIKTIMLVIYFSVAVLVTQSRAIIGLSLMLIPLFYFFKCEM